MGDCPREMGEKESYKVIRFCLLSFGALSDLDYLVY